MAPKRRKGHGRKSRGKGLGPSARKGASGSGAPRQGGPSAGGLAGGGLDRAGMAGRSEEKGASPGSRKAKRRGGKTAGGKQRTGKRPARRDDAPPDVPDYVASAETVIDGELQRRKKPTRKDRRRGSPPKRPVAGKDKKKSKPAPASQTPPSRTASRIRPREDVKKIQASEDGEDAGNPTPPMGVPADEEDILEPVDAPSEEAKPLPADEEPEGPPTVEFTGSGLGLFFLLQARNLFALLGLAGLLASGALAVWTGALPAEATSRIPPDAMKALQDGFENLPPAVAEQADRLPMKQLPLPVAAGGAALVLLGLWFGRLVKHYRIRRTRVFGEPVHLKIGLPASLFQDLASLIIFTGTAGLATPWVVSWYHRFRLQHAFVKARRREKPMDFRGKGSEVLLRTLIGLVSLPLIALTLGVWGAALGLMRVKWEQNRQSAPAPSGRGMVDATFHGRFGPYLGRVLGGWLLTALTLGLGRPWALVWQWRWIADRTRFPRESERDSRRDEKKKKRTRRLGG